MPNFTGSRGDATTRGIRILTSTTNIRQMSVGGKARGLIEANAQEVENISRLQEKNLKKAFLPTTYGQFLSHFAATVGLSRYPQRNAEVISTDEVIRFFPRLGGTFGGINAGNGFTIPAGTSVVAPASIAFEARETYRDVDTADSVYDRSIHYTLTDDLLCATDATEAFASARSLSPGTLGNLAAPGMLKTHSFREYNDSLSSALSVTNTNPILNGFDEEGDSGLRYRISKEITAAEKANNVAIINAALSVPGVADVVIVPFEDGAGRFNVYIKSISPIISNRTIRDVQITMDEVKATGCVGYARRPFNVGVEIDSTLLYAQSFTDDVKDDIRENLSLATINYVNSLDLGQTLDLRELAAELKQIDGRVKSVGRARKTFFDGVYVWYPARLADNGRRREKFLAGRVEVPSHARIVMETTIGDPVRFA